jgi:cation:H+ antiporter
VHAPIVAARRGGRAASYPSPVSSLPLAAVLAVFGVAALAVWYAGIKLSDTTDVLADRLGLGEALGGLILLAVATNLPEIAITVSAALADNLGIAIGNILGGIAIQTVVLALIDAIGLGRDDSLMYRSASLSLVLEATLVIAVLVIAVMGAQLPTSADAGRLEPAALLIVAAWVAGLWLVGRSRRGLPWHELGNPPDGQEPRRGHAQVKRADRARRKLGVRAAAAIFAAGAVVTLVAGVALERSGEVLAGRAGMSGVVFGATFLAAATALPEVSTGLSSLRLGDYQLAVSDIFGGNAFLPVLFLPAGLIAGHAILPQAQPTDIYLTGLGALLTAVYVVGLIFRPRRQLWVMGADSWAVVALYALGVAGLIAIARG